MAIYTHDRILEYVDIITNKLNIQDLYTVTNLKYPNADHNYLLNDPDVLLLALIKHFEAQNISKEIHLIERENIGSFLGVYLLNHADYIYINIIKESSDCWQRFTKVKEFCSAFVGHYQSEALKNNIYEGEEDYAKSIEEAFKRKISSINTDGLQAGDMDCETFAIILAIELMIPKPHRHLTENLLKKVEQGETTLNDVAKSLMIPEAVLKFFKDKYIVI
jgi:hypothetical protein